MPELPPDSKRALVAALPVLPGMVAIDMMTAAELNELATNLCAVENYLRDIGRNGLADVVDQAFNIIDDLYDDAIQKGPSNGPGND